MSNESVKQALRAPDSASQIMERVLLTGDLSKLDSRERVQYYARVCESVGLNPLTKPFAYITLNGKLTLYALRDATDQLRKIHGVSLTIKGRETIEGVYVVTCAATDKTGRVDESTGAVSIATLRGDNLANAFMKAETKAKRRVTLSICGLGLLDETEMESIEPSAMQPEFPPITAEQEAAIAELIKKVGANKTGFLKYFGVAALNELRADQYDDAIAALGRKKAEPPAAAAQPEKPSE
jgi:hypothetical protein